MRVLALLLTLNAASVQSLVFSRPAMSLKSPQSDSSRRSAIQKGTAAVALLLSFQSPVEASGGATAGGAYLIRAKQRYSDRVKKGADSYLALEGAVSGGKLVKDSFFDGGKESAAEDFLAAAYLLANAFRSNSTTAPDSLPTVKKFKAFMKEYEATLKLAKKKGGEDAALESYKKSVDLLKVFLASVDL
mmetsp:Transcript_58067/g.131574  ORF Transcript_58067/g.131574 Transcript_58067/m.131574 type:complete len:189 (-) Transcript_58067:4-570(-)|eukprot:CAMPEP_0172603784 /NCGR_PEP_ID=MMETSP1068-20121228/24046_1 /TAXON_ID=35684 /ORGANISM="Pseudopedinella elastica, Strain CCMP716" /LENGTH=188 /DNA_ID=CAMNT_0013405659 /DNA_START=91 /DNA_END=657 /DNA_ORIENTATION=-